MAKTKKTSLNQSQRLSLYKDTLMAVLFWIGKHAFLVIIISVLVALVVGGLLFYNYVSLSEIQQPGITEVPVKFQDGTYQSVIKIWQDRDTIFNDTSKENYASPF